MTCRCSQSFKLLFSSFYSSFFPRVTYGCPQRYSHNIQLLCFIHKNWEVSSLFIGDHLTTCHKNIQGQIIIFFINNHEEMHISLQGDQKRYDASIDRMNALAGTEYAKRESTILDVPYIESRSCVMLSSHTICFTVDTHCHQSGSGKPKTFICMIPGVEIKKTEGKKSNTLAQLKQLFVHPLLRKRILCLFSIW